MKIKNLGIVAATLIAIASFFSGCMSDGPQAPPSKLDNAFFVATTNITYVTNIVDKTNIVTTTNTVIQSITNTISGLPVIQFVTNYNSSITTSTIPTLIISPQTNYTYAPNPAITGTAGAIGTILTASGISWGSLVGIGISSILGIIATLKSRQATKAQTIAGNSTQIIQVARNLIASLPNGSELSTQFNNFILQHQQDAGIANEVAAIVDNFVDPQDGNLSNIASNILKQLETPLPVANNTSHVETIVTK